MLLHSDGGRRYVRKLELAIGARYVRKLVLAIGAVDLPTGGQWVSTTAGTTFGWRRVPKGCLALKACWRLGLHKSD